MWINHSSELEPYVNLKPKPFNPATLLSKLNPHEAEDVLSDEEELRRNNNESDLSAKPTSHKKSTFSTYENKIHDAFTRVSSCCKWMREEVERGRVVVGEKPKFDYENYLLTKEEEKWYLDRVSDRLVLQIVVQVHF